MLEIAVFAAATLAVLLLLAYFQAPILLWSVAAGPLLVRRLSGGHVDLFDPPHVAEFARLLREAIAALLTKTDSAESQGLHDYDQS